MGENYYLLDDMEKYNKNFNRSQYENLSVEETCNIFKEYYKNNLPVDLLTWSRVNAPKDEMYWKDAFWGQVIFIRDNIMYLLTDSYEEYTNNKAMVINIHMSKSIINPVYQIKFKNVTMILRYNFYDWKVSVISNEPIECDFMNLFKYDTKINQVYCEGFKPEFVFESYSINKSKFTCEISDHYNLYTFMYILKNYICKINGG